MPQKQEYSPGPWELGGGAENVMGEVIAWDILSVYGDTVGETGNKEDAEHIVACVNAVPELVAALERVLRYVPPRGPAGSPHLRYAVQAARDVLAKAGVKKEAHDAPDE